MRTSQIMGKDLAIQIHEAYRFSRNFNPKWSFPRHMIIKLSKIKDRFLKAREKNISHYKRTLIRFSAGILAETLQARGEWDDIFKVLRGKKTTANQEYFLWQSCLSEMKEKDIQKSKLREFIIIRSYSKCLKQFFNLKWKDPHYSHAH